MSAPELRESVADIPAGAMFCRVNGEAFALRRVSPRALWLLSARRIPSPVSLSLHILQPESGKYQCYALNNFKTGPARRQGDAVLTRFCFEDPQIAAAIRRALNAYARCVELRGT